jgi:hypothetical protein
MFQSLSPSSAWGMPMAHVDMPVEAHYQEDYGINAENEYSGYM